VTRKIELQPENTAMLLLLRDTDISPGHIPADNPSPGQFSISFYVV